MTIDIITCIRKVPDKIQIRPLPCFRGSYIREDIYSEAFFSVTWPSYPPDAYSYNTVWSSMQVRPSGPGAFSLYIRAARPERCAGWRMAKVSSRPKPPKKPRNHHSTRTPPSYSNPTFIKRSFSRATLSFNARRSSRVIGLIFLNPDAIVGTCPAEVAAPQDPSA